MSSDGKLSVHNQAEEEFRRLVSNLLQMFQITCAFWNLIWDEKLWLVVESSSQEQTVPESGFLDLGRLQN